MEENRTNGVAWTALAVAIVALIFGWVAFNRTGVDFGQMIQQEFQEATQEIEKKYQEVELETRREASDALIEAGQDISVDGDPDNAGE